MCVQFATFSLSFAIFSFSSSFAENPKWCESKSWHPAPLPPYVSLLPEGMGLWLTQQKCHPAVPSAVSWLPGSSGEVCPSSSRNGTSQAPYAPVRMSLVADLLLTLLPRNDCSVGHSPPTLGTPLHVTFAP